MSDELPDHFWQNPEQLRAVINDSAEDFNTLREDAYDCVRLDAWVAIEPSPELHAFLQQRNRLVIERAARRLSAFGRRRAVVEALEQRLGDIAALGKWLAQTESGNAASAGVIFRRACDVARWLLNCNLRELEPLGISATDLSRQICEIETDLSNATARNQIAVAQKLITNSMPMPQSELAPRAHCQRPKPNLIPLPEGGERHILCITSTGFRIVDLHGNIRHSAKVPRRLRRLLLAAWAQSWSSQMANSQRGENDPQINAPLMAFFNIRDLQRLLGTPVHRVDVCTLRKFLRYTDGTSLIENGLTRLAHLDFCVDCEGKAQGETLRSYLTRQIKESGIQVPLDAPKTLNRL